MTAREAGCGTGALPIRRSARALLIDASQRVLLMRYQPADGAIWATPGGGVEAGESYRRALRRELAEEVGQDDAVLGPCIWTRRFALAAPYVVCQHERIYLVRVEHHAVAPRVVLSEEGVHEQRWFTLGEIARGGVRYSPARLASALASLITHGPPPRPLDIGS